ncbi:MAG: MBL fold metallo-hydrolase [Limisphaerales bacterium]
MRITNLNPAHDIGASSWAVELDGCRLLMDAGTHPKREGRDALPLYSKLPAGAEVDAIALTHCHHDHVGSLPVALQHFPNAHVLMTELSYFIVERVLHNSVNVMTRQREELGIREYPLYTHDEVDEIAALFQGFRFGREIEWASFAKLDRGRPSPTLEFLDAGHTLGAAGVMVRGARQTLFNTGDVSFTDQTLLKGARFDDVQADVLIMETTRGAKATPAGYSRDAEIARLEEAILATLARKGSVLIPAFALGRTQEVLAILALMQRAKRIPRQPIYIGGLGRVFTEIFDLEAHRAHRNHSSLRLTESLNLQVMAKKELEAMRTTGGRIYVLTSGMMNENTAAHDLALRFAGDERNTICFVGYTDPETPGGRLRAAKPGEAFFFSRGGGELTRHCEVLSFDMTGHALREELLDFVGVVDPRAVVLGHGDDDARAWFAEQILARHPKVKVLDPGPGETVEV